MFKNNEHFSTEWCFKKRSSVEFKGLVPNETVHLSHIPTSFGTRGSLILGIAIASHSIPVFLFLNFILQVKPRLDTSQRAPPPHQTNGYIRNGYHSRSESSRFRKRGYGKISAVDHMEANTGLLPRSFFFLLLPTRMPLTFFLLIPHGANRLHTAPLSLRPCPQRPPGLAIGTLNIQDVRSFGLA